MVALARVPCPKTFLPQLSPISWRMGPLTMTSGPTKYVVASTPCRLKASVHAASTAAITTGRYSGLQPAMTALMATFSTVAGARFGGTSATTSPGWREVPASIRATRSSVGGTTGRPSVMPCWSRNSNGSRSAGMRTRRAASFEASRRPARRRATSGSWTFEPQPGRDSGSDSPSRSMAGAAPPHRSAARSTSPRRSALPKPSKLARTLAPPSASTSAGTASKPYSSETSNSASSARGNVQRGVGVAREPLPVAPATPQRGQQTQHRLPPHPEVLVLRPAVQRRDQLRVALDQRREHADRERVEQRPRLRLAHEPLQRLQVPGLEQLDAHPQGIDGRQPQVVDARVPQAFGQRDKLAAFGHRVRLERCLRRAAHHRHADPEVLQLDERARRIGDVLLPVGLLPAPDSTVGLRPQLPLDLRRDRLDRHRLYLRFLVGREPLMAALPSKP